jgi:hypothetical protein
VLQLRRAARHRQIKTLGDAGASLSPSRAPAAMITSWSYSRRVAADLRATGPAMIKIIAGAARNRGTARRHVLLRHAHRRYKGTDGKTVGLNICVW